MTRSRSGLRRPTARPTVVARRRQVSAGRLRWCLALVALVLCLFAGRLFQVQGVDSNAYAAMAAAEGSRTVVLPAERGPILDRFGDDLATTTEAVAVTADPTYTAEDATEIAEVLHTTLDLDYLDTVEALRTPDTRFVYLARRIPTARADTAMDALAEAELAGVYTERDPLRSFPNHAVGANVIGLVDAEGRGVAGLEGAYDEVLHGTDGSATYEVTGSGEVLPLADRTVDEPEQGAGLQTTIDRDLQWYSDRRLAQAIRETGSEWGVAITMEVGSGEVLAMSQLPTFDPNVTDGLDSSSVNARGVQNVYEPGSVQKIMTMAAAADALGVRPGTVYNVPPSLTVDDYTIGDFFDHGWERWTAAGIMARSSNLGTIRAQEDMSSKQFHDYLEGFGFGSPSGVGLPGESGGILTDWQDWMDSNRATIAFGQGISVTSVQMAAAISAVANDGVYVQPSLVTGEVDADGEVAPTDAPESHRVVSTRAARAVTTMLEAATRDEGTANAGAIPGYRVAAKTGTAWRVDPETGTYAPGENTVSFAGYAPADDPRIMTYVVLDNPTDGSGGGDGAGPVFRDVMAMALDRYGIPPTGTPAPRVPLDG